MYNLDNYDNFILDYDGTLLNSMVYWYHAPSAFIRWLGKEPKADLDERIGKDNLIDNIMLMNNEYGFNKSEEEIIKLLDDFILATYPHVLTKDGAFRLLDFLKKNNKKIILLSASGKTMLERSIENTRVKDYLDHFFPAEIINKSKATGEAHEYVINELKLNRDKTIVLDDDINVIRSMNRLGIDSIAIKDFLNGSFEDEFKKISLAYVDIKDLKL
ncbi:MAG: HAD hydrolase-like protein [Acholeplasmatales bacterium]|nr:HAD hydrolase-like protein [Acholeplasmatales bacterium]